MPLTSLSPAPPEDVRVLVIEDNADDRELLLHQLRKIGIENHVKFVGDGESAVAYLSDLPPPVPLYDLMAIFLDLKLPSLSGLEVLRWIKNAPRVQNIPVIVMTSSQNPKDLAECERLKVSSFVPKPITFESFSKAITGLVQVTS